MKLQNLKHLGTMEFPVWKSKVTPEPSTHVHSVCNSRLENTPLLNESYNALDLMISCIAKKISSPRIMGLSGFASHVSIYSL
jgi:hypothetical protein